MAELLDQYNSPIQEAINPQVMGNGFNFNVIVPRQFSLATTDRNSLEKLRDEVMDKVKTCENSLVKFYFEYGEYIQSWRVQPRDPYVGKPRGFSNSKSGETHKATEALASIGFRMLTADDNFFMAVAKGLDDLGYQYNEEDLYAVEALLKEQLRKLKFKKELMVCERSLKLLGTVIFEEPWIKRLNPDGNSYFEGTGMQIRPLITTGFDTTAVDLDFSDYLYTIDYPSVWRLKTWARNDPETWDRQTIEQETTDTSWSEGGHPLKPSTNAWNRVVERRSRAGYTSFDVNIRELISYHGRLDVENPVIQEYWQSTGRQTDPSDFDFTMGILDGLNPVRFHMTQYGTWHSKFKHITHKKLEVEPLGYGVGKIGQRTQKDIDIFTSRTNDVISMAIYSMWKLGRFAGLKPSQMQIKPWGIVEMDDITQLEPLRPDVQSAVQALNLLAILREEIRNNTGASANLQAMVTKASATESSLAQTEAIRGVSVHAEIEAETFVREHLEQMHINNLDNLDEGMWISVTGEPKPRFVSRHNIPKNIGFEVKTTTDKDFRPERIQKILEALQMATSIRNVLPTSINAVEPLWEEFFRNLGLNPRLLHKPMNLKDQLEMNLQRMTKTGQNPQMLNETEGEQAGAEAGAGSNVSTPMGNIPTSPISTPLISGI